MKVQQFLDHHGIVRNPFAEEDAQTDPVFKEFCIESTYHPIWDKVYGDPSEPATSIIFGDKGSAETFKGRWHRLRRRLKYQTWQSYWQLALGCVWTAFLIVLVILVVSRGGQKWLPPWWVYPILLIAGWAPWLWEAWNNFWLARSI